MYKVSPFFLKKYLNSKKFNNIYFIYGNEFCLIEESQNLIFKFAKKNFLFLERFKFFIDKKTNWKLIFDILKCKSLFSKTQILFLEFNEKEHSIDYKNLNLIFKFTSIDWILIVISKNLLNFKIINLEKKILKKIVLISCKNFNKKEMLSWINFQSKKMGLKLEKNVDNLLCEMYENNLSSLLQIFKQILILWPNKKITLSKIQKIIDDSAYFTSFQLVEALLIGNQSLALRILLLLKSESNNIILFIRFLQKELILLIFIKKELSQFSLQEIFQKYKIWKSKEVFLKKALERLSSLNILKSFSLLQDIENIFQTKKDNNYLWVQIENLILLLCNPDFFKKIK